MKTLRSLWRDERGSMSLVSLFTLAMVIIGSVFLFYFFTAYIEKRQAQNIADAASLAAAQSLRDKFEEKLQRKSEEVWQRFVKKLDEEFALLPEDTSTTLEELAKSYLRGDELLPFLDGEKAFDPKTDWLLVMKEPYFESEFTARLNGELLYDTFRQNASIVETAARTAISLNRGKSSGASITFPDEGRPKLLVRAAAEITIDTIGVNKDIAALSAAGVSSKSFEIDVSGKMPVSIQW